MIRDRVFKRIVVSVVLCLVLGAQTFLEPAALSAATTSQNPGTDEINLLIEEIAVEKEIPSILLKVIAFKESTWRQFDKQGNPVMGTNTAHPAIGIMQVASYKDEDAATIEKLKTDIEFNIRTGADLLNEKWNFTPRIGDGDRNKLENWYFALWAYNIWSDKNNPNVLAANTPSGQQIPLSYQEKVLNLCANPDGFLANYIESVEISQIPLDVLPQTGIPAKTATFTTPEPVHYGDLGEQTNEQQPGQPKPDQPQPPKAPVEMEFKRVAGADRIDTAIRQALEGWTDGAPAVILARADNFPDALAGVPLAAKLEAPVLLTSSDRLDSRVAEALSTLNPNKVYLLGGEGALSSKVSSELKKLGWSDDRQIRLSGLTRYDTAASIALATARASSYISSASKGGQPGVEAVAIATGENFPDALSIASIAGAKQMPILLTDPKALPAETLNALKELQPKQLYLIGGEGAISAAVQTELQAQLNLSSSQITRLHGASRYDTMAAVAQAFIGETEGLSFATGEDFPDALAGAALAARLNATVILLPKDSLEKYPNLKAAINQHPCNSDARSYIFGGTGAISSEREQELKGLLSRVN